ncbi:hypothetical protein DSOL_4664 [Desulfosporosinus metallidurans]|uniref:Uncharacterized protein n=1 Tax=Desulfosporosinus metallidurans TaxID=1888891 RepID=A0A1Q8QIM1_9FIRM|nr:hypothetical protein DSOL_4664 [Desulfosporosinus metallidurans]
MFCPLVPPLWLTAIQNWITQPLRFTSITKLHHYYGLFRPCITHRYFHPCGSSTWIFLLASYCRFPRSTQKPMLCSCHLHAGHRLDSKQVSSRLIPGQRLPPGFDDVPTLSTRYQRFICIRLHSTYLTKSSLAFSLTLTTIAFDYSSLRWFGISTCIAIPRGPPSSSVQHSCYSGDSSCRLNAPSWRTVIGVSHKVCRFEIGLI